MKNTELSVLRQEYASLVLVADGLISVLRAGAACNLLTMARLADEARQAARKVASLIESMCRGQSGLKRLVSVIAAAVRTVLTALIP